MKKGEKPRKKWRTKQKINELEWRDWLGRYSLELAFTSENCIAVYGALMLCEGCLRTFGSHRNYGGILTMKEHSVTLSLIIM